MSDLERYEQELFDRYNGESDYFQETPESLFRELIEEMENR